MTDETRDDARLEQDEEGDVEAHQKLKGAMAEPGEDFRLESDDDVEAHSKLKGAKDEPGEDFRLESDDDVEGHFKMKAAPKL